MPNAQCPRRKQPNSFSTIVQRATRLRSARTCVLSLVGCMTRSVSTFSKEQTRPSESWSTYLLGGFLGIGHWALGVFGGVQCPMPNAEHESNREREVELCDPLVGHTHTHTRARQGDYLNSCGVLQDQSSHFEARVGLFAYNTKGKRPIQDLQPTPRGQTARPCPSQPVTPPST